ncbi:MAG TPA: hypothetical protein VN867_00610 [Candidatus Binataceae bacterium]|nr:hypothetical protein [Candidatus Binataceae bacterium]
MTASRERAILAISTRETNPEAVSEFAPITRGPIVATLGVIGLGIVAGFYIVAQKAARIWRR